MECKNIKSLLFDFFIPKYNTCIEFDGEQHFRPINFMGGIDKFEKTKINDNIKTIFCQENNIKLIRIPYYDIDKIEIIFETLF